MTIVLGSLFPERLNLNGDQGNLLAMQRYLQAAGFDVRIASVGSANEYDNVHFVLFGHGSLAAMASLETQLSAVDFAFLMQNRPGLAIGSGFEYLSGHNLTKGQIVRGDRVSQFEVGKLGKLSALGYRNTNSGLSNLEMNGNWICTMLHGPILAKNPELLDRAAKAAVTAAGLLWPERPSVELQDWVAQLNRISGVIWAVETQEDFEALEI
jgi:CobQ-like glutamine amidotransferase family enzyme